MDQTEKKKMVDSCREATKKKFIIDIETQMTKVAGEKKKACNYKMFHSLRHC